MSVVIKLSISYKVGEKMKILLDENKNYYKANLHTHSLYSDGKLSVEEWKEEFKKRGYSVVAFTDHDRLIDNTRLDDPEFMTITSTELSIKENEQLSTLKASDMRCCHLNFYSLDRHNNTTPFYSSVYDHYSNNKVTGETHYTEEYKRIYSPEQINKMISLGKEMGFIVAYNHPSWSLENAETYLKYDGCFAVEIYNNTCIRDGLIDDERVFEDMLRAEKKIYCTACDDCHRLEDGFGGWVMINADRLDYDVIMSALINGDFYASTGPVIHSLTLDGNTVSIKTSDAERIVLLTKGRRSKTVKAVDGAPVSSAEFKILPEDKFFRIRVEDKSGKAYTQAYNINL